MKGLSKPNKDKCEICGENNKKLLDLHHIIPRTEPDSTNDWKNLAVLCSNCHRLTHAGDLVIIGIYPSTSGRILIYEKFGIKNVDLDPPSYHEMPKGTKI